MTDFVGGEEVVRLPEGLYELLRTNALEQLLENESELQPVFVGIQDGDAPDVLSRHVAAAVRTALDAAKPEDHVALANQLLKVLGSEDCIAAGPSQLQSLHHPDTLKRRQLRRPTTNLSDSALLTNSKEYILCHSLGLVVPCRATCREREGNRFVSSRTSRTV